MKIGGVRGEMVESGELRGIEKSRELGSSGMRLKRVVIVYLKSFRSLVDVLMEL